MPKPRQVLDVTADQIGEHVADLVECIADGYQQEFAEAGRA